MIAFNPASRLLALGLGAALLTACSQQDTNSASEPDSAGAGESSATVERVEKGNLVWEGIPDIPPDLSERIRQYQNTRSASFQGWSAESGILIATRFGEVTQIHRVGMPGGARKQLTFYDEPVGGAVPAPEDTAGFLFTKDRGGDENYQIHYFDEQGGGIRQLTDGESRNESPVWAPDGEAFAFRSNRRDGTSWDILVATPDDPDSARTVFQGDSHWWGPVAFSHDGTKLAIVKYTSITDTETFLIDVETGGQQPVVISEEDNFILPVEFTPDDRGLYLISDAGSEFRTLRHYDLESGEVTDLTGDIPWNVESVDVAPNGKLIAFSVNEAGQSRLEIRETEDFSAVPGPDLPPGVIGGLSFSPDSSKIGFTLSPSTSPSDAYSYDVATRSLVRWTESEVGGLATDEFVSPDLITYQSFDDREISAFVYRPDSEGPHPVVIAIHGGPESQYRPTYSSTLQLWVNELGVSVIAPNVRGSSGYGKTFVSLDNGYNREDSVKDIGALLDWIAEQPDLDADRAVVYGGSYGGYMVLASMTHYSDRLKGGIDVVGISNFVTFLENTEDYRKDVRRPEYGDERDPEMRKFLESISPANHAGRITKPLFIIQGANDPRVPASESEQMKQEIRANGGAVWYLLAKDEGHGFRKKSNKDFQAAAQMLFLEELFGNATESAAAGESAAD